jgi:hypothetical protein
MALSSALPVDPATVGLLVALGVVFIIGFKVVRTVISTVVVSAFCGGFYIASAVLLDYNLTVSRVLQFAVLGSSLYFGFKLISGTYDFASSAVKVPLKAFSAITYPFRKLVAALTIRQGDEDKD